MSVATASLRVRPMVRGGPATGLLVAVLIIGTAWSILAGGWTDSTPSVALVGLAGVVEAVVLARLRVRRAVAAAAAPVLLFISLLPTTAGSRPAGATGGLGHVLAQYAGAAVTGLLGNALWEFNVALGALLWICGAWAAWFAVREKRGAIATGPCWAVLAVNVINAPSTTSVTFPAALAAAAAVLLIAAVHLDRLSDSWTERRVSVLPGTRGRFGTAAVAGGLFIVVLALVVPPLTTTDISGRLFGFGSGAGNGHGPHPGGVGATGGATVRFNAATIPGGALSLSNSLVLSYQSTLATGVYLRMATDGVFDGGNWLPDESANNNGDDTQEISDPGLIARDRRASIGAVGIDRQDVTLTVKLYDDSSDTNTLPFAGEPESDSVAARVSGLTGPETDNELLTVDRVEALRQVMGTTFTTTATESTASTAQLRAAGTAYPSFIVRDFLGLADDNTGGAGVIRTLAQQWTRTQTTPYDKAVAIESTLRDPTRFHYTLKPRLPTGLTWPLTYFLTTSHSGYCQYFAAAMGAMLRAIGIPAQLVNGYGPGSAANSASRRTTPDTNWTVTSNDAHTWVEAYFPHYGWIPFEPTPPSAAGDYEPFVRGALGATIPPAGNGGGPRASATPRVTTPVVPSTADGGAVRSNGGHAFLVALAALAGILILAAALFAVWFLAPRDVRGVWRRVGLVGRVVGVPRDRSLTFGEYVQRVAAALPADGAGERRGSNGPSGRQSRVAGGLGDIAAISDRVFYGNGSRRHDEVARIKSAWRRVALLAPGLGRRAMVVPEVPS